MNNETVVAGARLVDVESPYTPRCLLCADFCLQHHGFGF
jgi:hypothetical protein